MCMGRELGENQTKDGIQQAIVDSGFMYFRSVWDIKDFQHLWEHSEG